MDIKDGKIKDWLSYASGYIYAEREQWGKAYEAFLLATKKNPSLMEISAVDAERTKRMLNGFEGVAAFDFSNNDLKYFKDIENGTLKDKKYDSNLAYSYLHQGDIIKAYDFMKGFENNLPYGLRLFAVSNGVSEDIKEQARKLEPTDGININTIWYLLAFQILEKENHDQTLQQLQSMNINTSEVRSFINALQTKNIDQASRIIKKQEVYFKGHFYAIGHIILKGAAPKSWKRNAGKLLFASEKPYLGE